MLPEVAMQAPQPEPTYAAPAREVALESAPATEASRLVYDVWAIVRRAAMAFFGLLLMLLAGMLIAGLKRRV